MTNQPVFLLFKPGGKVHVLRRMEDLTAKALGIESTMATWLMASQVAICGAKGLPGRLYGISSFSDDNLCNSCRSHWTGDPDRLFEHPVT